MRLLICFALIVFLLACDGEHNGGLSGADGDAGGAGPPPKAQVLIRTALEAGRIDYGTSLLYRAYASVQDPRLPPDLRGSGSTDEDQALWFEIDPARAPLTQEQIDLLRPFTLRPNHAESIYNMVPLPQSAVGGVPAEVAKAGGAACPTPFPVEPVSRRTWVSVKAAYPVPVLIWFSCTGNTLDDGFAEIEADRMVEVIDQIWTPMVKLMGDPILDAGGPDEGGDGSIDIYLVDTFRSINRGGEDADVPSGTSGAARPSPPEVGLASSGFIVLPRRIVSRPDFHSTVIHEFFHVLQYGHNAHGMRKSNLSGEGVSYWFVEASAAWAMVHFDRVIPWPMREAKEILRQRFKGFQQSRQSLHVPIPPEHAYEAFIWPFFMEQESDEKSIARAWVALEGVGSWEAANAALDGVFSFAKNFHNFAVRNVNDAFLPGDPLPEERRHVHLDGLFPDRQLPDRDPPQALTAGQPTKTAVSLRSLSAGYFQYLVEDPRIQQVMVDFSALSPAGDLDIDALLNIVDRGWVLRNYTGKGKLTFCFNNPDEHLRDLWLVLSNHSQGFTDKIQGDLVVTPLTSSCAAGWVGTVKQVTKFGFQDAKITITTFANVTYEFDKVATAEAAAQGRPGEQRFKFRNGTFTYEKLAESSNSNPPCRNIETAGGAIDGSQPGTVGIMLVISSTSSFYGDGASEELITLISNCNDSNVDETFVFPAPLSVVWWNGDDSPGNVTSVDGLSIRRTYTSPNTPNTSYEISLDQIPISN